MKTDSKTIAGILATVIWAGGEYEEAQQAAVEEVGDALELNPDLLIMEVDREVKKLNKLDEEGVNAYLQKVADAVDDEEIGFALESALQVAISDNVLGKDELNTINAIGEALGMDASDVKTLVDDLVKSEPELEVEIDQA